MGNNTNVGLRPLVRFFRLLKKDRKDIVFIYVYAIFNGLITLVLPLGIQAIIALISGGQISASWAILSAFVVLGITFSGILKVMQLKISEVLQQDYLLVLHLISRFEYPNSNRRPYSANTLLK